jgi:hypothetical protein
MLTIKNFEKLKGVTIVLPNFLGYNIIEAKQYISPVRNEWMYVVKLKPSHNHKDISFSLYRNINKKEDGYRLYNSDTADYSIIKLESFKNMRTFSDIIQKELEWISNK